MLRLDHVVFPVRDAGASLAFYRDIVGLPLIDAHEGEDWGAYPWLMMIFAVPGGGEIVLVELRGAPAPDYRDLPNDARHYAMATDAVADLARWRTTLRTAGVRFWEEDHGGQQSIYFEARTAWSWKSPPRPAARTSRPPNAPRASFADGWPPAPRTEASAAS